MKHISDQAIVLGRTDFGEADRIITFLTRSHGKVRGLARGVRKQKSKLAGGIELFSISEISFFVGRGEIKTIASSRLVTHFGQIVKDLERTNTAYEFIKQLNKQTEDHVEEAYFNILQVTFESLDSGLNVELIKIWFKAQLLRLGGIMPNLTTDQAGQKLSADKNYHFDSEAMCFMPATRGKYGAQEIKFLRLIFGDNPPSALQKIKGFEELISSAGQLVQPDASAFTL